MSHKKPDIEDCIKCDWLVKSKNGYFFCSGFEFQVDGKNVLHTIKDKRNLEYRKCKQLKKEV